MLVEECSECGGDLIETDADTVCKYCGLVFQRRYANHQAIGNALDIDSAKHQSLGSRESIADGLGTFIDYYAPRGQGALLKDGQGRMLPQETRRRYMRLKRMNDIFFHVDDKQREYRGLMIIHRIVNALELSSDLKESAASYFRKACQRKQGSPTLAELAIGAIYLSVRSSRVILKIDDIKEVCDNSGYPLEKKRMLWAAAYIRKKTGATIKIPTPEEYLERVIHNLSAVDSLNGQIRKAGITPEEYFVKLRQATLHILRVFPHQKRGGKNPFIFACAAVCGAEIVLRKINPRRRILTQREVAVVNDVAEFSLREHFLTAIKGVLDNMSEKLRTSSQVCDKEHLLSTPLQSSK